MLKSQPLVSIIIATFNSQKTLSKVLTSIQKQTYPKSKIEILIVDGGSTDKTLSIVTSFNCTVISNPRTEPVYAKYLGYKAAKGKYVLYYDHDEVIDSVSSIEDKVKIFEANASLLAVIGSGYRNPEGYPIINNYINEFGDPFSFFIYRLSKDERFFIPTMKNRYRSVHEDNTSITFDFSEEQQLPIIELCAAGSMIDAELMKKKFLETLKDPKYIPHFFYILLKEKKQIAIMKRDVLIHYSSETVGKYLNKIKWRIKNNIYHVDTIGASGFTGRVLYQSPIAQYKKYLFIPYTYFLISVIDSIMLVITRRNILYLIHSFLCFYTANLIVYHSILKLCGVKLQLKSYDESTLIHID